MEILPNRDLIQDDLGNYYLVSKIIEDKLILVNAVVFLSFNRLLSEGDDIQKQYDEPIALGHYPTDLLKSIIKQTADVRYPSNLYELSEVQKIYSVEIDPLYERKVYHKVE